MTDYTILVNKENLLDRNYIPNDLVITDENENNFHMFIDPNSKPMVSNTIIPYFQALQKAAKKAGLKDIIIDSGYRSFDYQQKVLEDFILKVGYENAVKRVAIPGSSEHQTGLAFDIAYINNKGIFEEPTEDDLEIKWLQENSYKFGFILRYPKNKENITGYQYEPWHYRFVGVELATILYNQEITLEEYYERLKNNNISKKL